MSVASVPSVTDTPLDLTELRTRRRESALTQLVASACAQGAAAEGDALLRHLLLRERAGSTALGRGFAVPHAHSLFVRSPRIVLGRSARGIEWSDGEVVQLVALVVTPGSRPWSFHVAFVERTVHALRLQRTRQRLLEAGDVEAARARFAEASA